ncbi:MAG: ABC transporter permease [Planctomycetota bacterium]|nr:ABC transporter permease [Planctomycetota bacterium]
MIQTLTIARNTLVESLRQPVVILLVLLCGIFQVFNTWTTGYAMGYDESAEVTGDDKLMLDIAMATVFVLGMLMAAFIATATMSREIENKTVLTVVSKPVSRVTVVIGKYLGVAGSLSIAVLSMLIFVLMGVRHGVMSTAADVLDAPILTFGISAVVISLLVGAWGNYYYGWSFGQTSVVLMLPLLLLAYVGALIFTKEWKPQPIWTDFKPQVTLACMLLLFAILVMSSVATAASTRLGQVMTIVVCAGVFVASLLSNHFVGRYAYSNQPLGQIDSIKIENPLRPNFDGPGDEALVTLKQPPVTSPKVGSSFYFGPNPSGFDLASAPFPALADANGTPSWESLLTPGNPARLLITNADGQKLAIKQVGERPVALRTLPVSGDYAFTQPTKANPAALGLWSAFPNLHFFYLIDAVTQNQKIPLEYAGLSLGYAALQVGAMLALAVALFQTRDVG